MKNFWALGIFTAVLAAAMFTGYYFDQAAKTPPPPSVAAKTPDSPPVHFSEPKPTPKPESFKIAEFSGRGTKKTPTFNIPPYINEWYVTWATRPVKGSFPGNFIIIIHNTDGRYPPETAANVVGKDQDMTVMRRSGNFYLEIIATQPYGIIIGALFVP